MLVQQCWMQYCCPRLIMMVDFGSCLSIRLKFLSNASTNILQHCLTNNFKLTMLDWFQRGLVVTKFSWLS